MVHTLKKSLRAGLLAIPCIALSGVLHADDSSYKSLTYKPLDYTPLQYGSSNARRSGSSCCKPSGFPGRGSTNMNDTAQSCARLLADHLPLLFISQ